MEVEGVGGEAKMERCGCPDCSGFQLCPICGEEASLWIDSGIGEEICWVCYTSPTIFSMLACVRLPGRGWDKEIGHGYAP